MEMDYMDKRAIETQVFALLKEYGYASDKNDYVDIVDFVRKLGFVVGNAQLDDSEDGFLVIHANKTAENGLEDPNDKVIGVNANRSLNWKRFIIAHEFAHSILHYKAGEIYLHRENRKGKDNEENEADYFAAALLMPKDSFKRLYMQFEKNGLNRTAVCLQLATIFKVPLDSVSRRVDEVFEEDVGQNL